MEYDCHVFLYSDLSIDDKWECGMTCRWMTEGPYRRLQQVNGVLFG